MGTLAGAFVGGSETIASLGVGAPVGLGIAFVGTVTGVTGGKYMGDEAYEEVERIKKYY